jgi:hypothetical protein
MVTANELAVPFTTPYQIAKLGAHLPLDRWAKIMYQR